jgi:hypothetical protein
MKRFLMLALAPFLMGMALRPTNWNILWSQNMPTHPDALADGWSFYFPQGTDFCRRKYSCPGVHYVMTPYTKSIEQGSTITVSGRIEVSGTPSFNYHLEPSNICNSTPNARVLLQRRDDNMYDSDNRYWSDPVAIPLVPGNFSVSIKVERDQWRNVDGTFNEGGFNETLQDMGNIGLTFGGGCFFGHGVNVSGGSARFVVTEFAIK